MVLPGLPCSLPSLLFQRQSYYSEEESSKSEGEGVWERGNMGIGAPLPQLRQEGAEAGTAASWEHLV